jgi:hypothetical protein
MPAAMPARPPLSATSPATGMNRPPWSAPPSEPEKILKNKNRKRISDAFPVFFPFVCFVCFVVVI